MTPEAKEKLSKSLKNKWASGTRRPNPKSGYEKASISHKRGFAEGTRKQSIQTSERYSEMSKMRDPEKVAETNRRTGAQKKGTPNPPGLTEKGPKNQSAKYWILKAPTQEIIRGMNLNELIRQHAHLFAPDDIKWFGHSNAECRAAKALRKLFSMKKDGTPRHHSWKGWMIGDRLDKSPNVEVRGWPLLACPA